MSRALVVPVVAVVAAVSAAPAQSPVTRDSAGIHIVENVTPLWTRHAPEHVDGTPILSLGSAMGAPDEQFGAVTDAIRLSNGDVVVADAKNYELRVFGGDGRFIRRIGRRGEGPGDLQEIWSIFRLPGDVILVWDVRTHRLTWFTADGKVRRTLNVDHPPSSDAHTILGLRVAGPLANGSILSFVTSFRFNPPAGMYVDSAFGFRVDTAGHLHPTHDFRHGESWIFTFSNGDLVFDERPFTTHATLVTTPAALWFTDGVGFEVRQFDANGRLRQIVRERRTPEPVMAAEAEAYRKSQIDEARTEPLRNESTRAEIVASNEAAMKWLSFPARKAAFMALKLDPAGGIWAREYGDSTATEHWDRFDKSGRLLGEVDMPAGLDVLEIGSDYVLGRVRDEDGVEGVRLYRLVR